MSKLGMKNVETDEIDWLDKLERKSNSIRTRTTAKVSLNIFDRFCESQGYTRDEVITQYKIWYNPKPKPDELVRPDIRNICLSLDKFVGFLGKDHEFSDGRVCKKKSFKSITVYFGFVKSYLRICHGLKISVDDIKDFVTFPTQRKDPRVPITLKQLKEIMNHASPKKKALYYVLVSSGMRLGEALTLTKKNIHLNENPFRILLYNNGLSTRFVVSPQVSWILGDSKCDVCNPVEKTEQTKKNLVDFVIDFSKKFGKGIAKRAVELRLLRHGINTQPKRVMQAERYIEQYFDVKKINLEELAEQYGLKERTTHLYSDKRPKEVLQNES